MHQEHTHLVDRSEITKLLCQPFADKAATIVCHSCFKLLTFPAGARKVRCANCRSLTTAVLVRCTKCNERNEFPLGSSVEENACRICGYLFQPLAKITFNVPKAESEKKTNISSTGEVWVKVSSEIPCKSSRKQIKKVIMKQPLYCSVEIWAGEMGFVYDKLAFYDKDRRKFDGKHTPIELDIKPGDEIKIKKRPVDNAGGHEFLTAQFNAPTCCSHCKEFIWGLFNQGKKCAKCRAPVHHRCAEKVSSMCEAEMRHVFGIVNANDEDDEGDIDAVMGVVVEDHQRIEFAAAVREVQEEPERDPEVMKKFRKMCDFTDEEIASMWMEYDTDESGLLSYDEVRLFLKDLLGAQQLPPAAFDRIILRMDTGKDGVIQWEEFWAFLKAQQDEKFVSQFRGKEDISTDELYELWYKYDVDGSGFLEIDELLQLLRDISNVDTAEYYTSKLESFLKPDASVSWDEFYNVIVPIIQGDVPSRRPSAIIEQQQSEQVEELVSGPESVTGTDTSTEVSYSGSDADDEVEVNKASQLAVPTYRDRLILFYKKYVPEKDMTAIDRMLEVYQGKEDEMFAALERKYGPEPVPQGTLLKFADANALRSRLTRFYSYYAPEKLSQLDLIVDRFISHEEKLFSLLIAKYGPEPSEQQLQGKKHETLIEADFASELVAQPLSSSEHELIDKMLGDSTQVEDPLEEFRTRLIKFYLIHDPDRVANVDKICVCYAGREEEAMRKLYIKYNCKPEEEEERQKPVVLMEEVEPRDSDVVSFRQRVAAFLIAYSIYKADLESYLDKVCQMYAGREEEAIQILIRKYGPEPVAAAPSASETAARKDRPFPVSADLPQLSRFRTLHYRALAWLSKYRPERIDYAPLLEKKYAAQQLLLKLYQKYKVEPMLHCDRIVHFYCKHNPTKKANVARILGKYVGREEEVIEALQAKYNAAEPDLNTEAWERLGRFYQQVLPRRAKEYWVSRVTALYQEYAPYQLEMAMEPLLAAWAGQEEEMMRMLVKKYGPEPRIQSSLYSLRDRVIAIFAKHSPKHVTSVDQILKLYRRHAKQDEQILFLVQSKVGPEPTTYGEIAAFRALDVSKTGKVAVDDVWALLVDGIFYNAFEFEEVIEMLGDMELDGDGKITFESFLTVLYGILM